MSRPAALRVPLPWLAVALLLAGACEDSGGTKTEAPARAEPEKAAKQPAADWPEGKPPVVLVTVDTLRRDHLGTYGYDRPTSPALDAFARHSVVFDHAYAAHTNTAPSHASILSGLHPGEHGVQRNGSRIRDDVTMLQEALHAAGYRTGAFVSGWTVSDYAGLTRGFDTYDASFEGKDRPATQTWAVARPWVQERLERGEPFFLWLHLFDPHYPYDPPPHFARRFLPKGRGLAPSLPERIGGPLDEGRLSPQNIEELVARYDGEIAFSDLHFAMLLAQLEEAHLFDRALVLFTSDHGETLSERPEWAFDHGCRVTEEQVAIPMLLKLPGGRHAGTRTQALAHHVDMMPTLLDALGLPIPDGLSGRSLLPAAAGRPEGGDGPRPLYFHARPDPRRLGDDAPDDFDTRGLVTAVRRGDHKLVEYPRKGAAQLGQLYDLHSDPGERAPMTTTDPGAAGGPAGALHDRLARFREQTGLDARAPAPELSPKTEEMLRALGYVE